MTEARLQAITVVAYQDEFASHFAALNYAWIEQYFEVEEEDRKALDDPRAYAIESGGEIFFVQVAGQIAGCVAMVPKDTGVFELAKMAVDPRFQGQGLSKRLMEACIAFARAQHAKKIILSTNQRLAPALALYRNAGFVAVPVGEDERYVRSDLRMELTVNAVAPSPR